MLIWIKAIVEDKSFWEALLDNITIFSADYAEGELRLERRWNATYVLILINVGVHYALVILGNNWHETVVDYLSFFPGKLHLWNLLISRLASNFLHADADHLWWNMIFLYAFGIVLERRIGWRQFTSLDREDVRLLRKNQVMFSFLTSFEPQKYYFLVEAKSSEELMEIELSSQVIQLEDRTYLAICSDLAVAEEWPLTIKKKRIAIGQVSLPAYSTLIQPFQLELSVDPVYEQLASAVSRFNLYAGVYALQNFGTRYAFTENCLLAGQHIHDYFIFLGLQPRFHEFSYSGYTIRNVIADVRGLTQPEEVVIICAHYDSISDQRWTLAPGADDNASGTAAVMEAARILILQPLDFTVRFIAFSAEEQGLIGSQRYVQSQLNPRENIVAVINLDMIAYADLMPEDLDIIVNQHSDWLGERAVALARLYDPVEEKKIVNPSFVYSDHASFWDRGISALCAIEDFYVTNPYYHKTTDTIDTLNFDFYEQSTRAALITTADLAQVIRPGYPATPKNLWLTVSTYASIFNYVKKIKLSWEAVGGAIGYNVYRSNISRSGYKKLNEIPISTTHYVDLLLPTGAVTYYVVTAVSSLTQESNLSREVYVLPTELVISSTWYFSPQWRRN